MEAINKMAKKTQEQANQEKVFIVGDKSYLTKGGKVYKTGEEISLNEQEYENVKDLIIEVTAPDQEQEQEKE
jgi:hypothetical protein